MKLPNNYGSISRLGGNRRRPFMIRKGTKIIGYHATKADALQALADYNNTPPRSVITVRSVYNAWFDSHRHNVSQSAVASYINAVKHIEPILDMPIDCVKLNHLQSIIDTMRTNNLSYASCKKVRSLLNMIFDYAIINEYCTNKPSQYLELGRNVSIKPHTTFTRQQINKLWNSSHPMACLPLILIYSGMRSIELRQLKRSDVNLKQRYFNIRQSKTASGVRIIPIHPRILASVERLASLRYKYLLTDVETPYSAFSAIFNDVMRHEKLKHTTHDCRHTFATLLSNANANEVTRRRLLGHAGANVTDVYTHKNLTQLRKAIMLIK